MDRFSSSEYICTHTLWSMCHPGRSSHIHSHCSFYISFRTRKTIKPSWCQMGLQCDIYISRPSHLANYYKANFIDFTRLLFSFFALRSFLDMIFQTIYNRELAELWQIKKSSNFSYQTLYRMMIYRWSYQPMVWLRSTVMTLFMSWDRVIEESFTIATVLLGFVCLCVSVCSGLVQWHIRERNRDANVVGWAAIRRHRGHWHIVYVCVCVWCVRALADMGSSYCFCVQRGTQWMDD